MQHLGPLLHRNWQRAAAGTQRRRRALAACSRTAAHPVDGPPPSPACSSGSVTFTASFSLPDGTPLGGEMAPWTGSNAPTVREHPLPGCFQFLQEEQAGYSIGSATRHAQPVRASATCCQNLDRHRCLASPCPPARRPPPAHPSTYKHTTTPTHPNPPGADCAATRRNHGPFFPPAARAGAHCWPPDV